MKPLSEFVFESIINANIQITIKAYDFEHARHILDIELKYSGDYKLRTV